MAIALISTGTELLKGSCCNTDLAFAGAQLNAAGVPFQLEIATGDTPEHLAFAIGTALQKADTLLISGGLGPTADDITLETVAKFFGVGVSIHPELKEKVETFWAQRHTSRCPKFQYKQAMLPDNGRFFANPAGVASGIGFDPVYGGRERHIYLLPGPPGEFETVFPAILQEIIARRPSETEYTNGFYICNMGETLVAAKIEPLLKNLPVKIAYTAQSGGTKLFLSGQDETLVSAVLESCFNILSPNALPPGHCSLPEYLVEKLTASGKTVCCAESCTGGLVADAFVNIPGASGCFTGGIAAYDNSVKERLLAVPAEILRDHGAVSAECAEAMAIGACKILQSDYAVSTTGIAGPGGGSDAKPVGLVYIAAAGNNSCLVRELRLRGNRRMIRERAAAQALNLLKELLESAGTPIC